jgi:hypothetical protein
MLSFQQASTTVPVRQPTVFTDISTSVLRHVSSSQPLVKRESFAGSKTGVGLIIGLTLGLFFLYLGFFFFFRSQRWRAIVEKYREHGQSISRLDALERSIESNDEASQFIVGDGEEHEPLIVSSQHGEALRSASLPRNDSAMENPDLPPSPKYSAVQGHWIEFRTQAWRPNVTRQEARRLGLVERPLALAQSQTVVQPPVVVHGRAFEQNADQWRPSTTVQEARRLGLVERPHAPIVEDTIPSAPAEAYLTAQQHEQFWATYLNRTSRPLVRRHSSPSRGQITVNGMLPVGHAYGSNTLYFHGGCSSSSVHSGDTEWSEDGSEVSVRPGEVTRASVRFSID